MSRIPQVVSEVASQRNRGTRLRDDPPVSGIRRSYIQVAAVVRGSELGRVKGVGHRGLFYPVRFHRASRPCAHVRSPKGGAERGEAREPATNGATNEGRLGRYRAWIGPERVCATM